MKRLKSRSSSSPSVSPPLLPKRGRRFRWIGIVLAIIGFYILRLTDPAGQNWASVVSPFLLVCGYTLFGIGIALRDPAPPPN